jgi:hypothetical protein
MLAAFCLRLACGLVACLGLLSPEQVNSRYYRTQFLITFALTGLALILSMGGAGIWTIIALLAGIVSAFCGALSWSLQGAPAGKTLIFTTTLAILTALVLAALAPPPSIELPTEPEPSPAWRIADDLSAAALLGTALAAMLLGHFYLIAPGMPLQPLMRLLAVFFAAVLVRSAVGGAGLFFWTREHSLANLDNAAALWLAVRWAIGLAGPLVLGWMARQSAKIRSTQSATGILYVVVIFCFLGELTSLLLGRTTGSLL